MEPKSLEVEIYDVICEHRERECALIEDAEVLKSSLATAIRSYLSDKIDQCLIYNDSDTHIIAEDLREEFGMSSNRWFLSELEQVVLDSAVKCFPVYGEYQVVITPEQLEQFGDPLADFWQPSH